MHQASAIDAVLSNRSVVVSTSTASGKSMCYTVPTLEFLAKDPDACAIFMYPTKALAQDQLGSIRGMIRAAFGDRGKAPAVDVYDGDTPMR